MAVGGREMIAETVCNSFEGASRHFEAIGISQCRSEKISIAAACNGIGESDGQQHDDCRQDTPSR
jgi:hypothetical protein